ncbi:MAG TPA: DMT family transporter [Burkholderiales bacterium]|nr:DMT family transporter [Burkholderiales bacterium]
MNNNIVLYIIATLIWGSTWIAITFQLGKVPLEASVVYRFVLASGILFAYGLIRGLKFRFSPREHGWMALQGLLFFSLTYVCAYLAASYITSGLVAVMFSFIVFLNMFGMRLFFGTLIRREALVGAVFGVLGIALIFLPTLGPLSSQPNPLLGFSYALMGAIFAALGNMVTIRNYGKGIAVAPLNAYAMLYGALFVIVYVILKGGAFAFDWSGKYVLSLLYLSIVGTALVFGVYVTLMGRIGADRAGYLAVAVPVVALMISTLFEALRWQPVMYVGLACCFAGNVMVLKSR